MPVEAAPPFHILAAAINATYRLCLVPPVTVHEVQDAAVIFRTSQFTREANARILEALRDTLGPTYSMEWVDKDHLRVWRL